MIATTYKPATDLGYLLSKHPDRCQSFELNFGKAHVFFPEATSDRCTAALLLDIDPVSLIRRERGGLRGLDQYVNDRPFASSSFLSVAIARVLGTALGGRSKEHLDLADTPIPLELTVHSLPCGGGEAMVRSLFEPLGYAVRVESRMLDVQYPDWGPSRHLNVHLTGLQRLSDALKHLYVLIPVLDDDKHYWVGKDEVQKLLRHGSGWLESHPAKELIAERYLAHQRSLTREALAALLDEDQEDPDEAAERFEADEQRVEAPISLNEARQQAVLGALKEAGAHRVLDLGCGEGCLLRTLAADRSFDEIVGSLEVARDRLHLDSPFAAAAGRVKLLHASLIYRDRRLSGYDAAAIVEVIEHLDLARLAAFERVLFEFASPRTVIVTTPNFEYNVRFEGLAAGAFRHHDHRFEWSRAEFDAWATTIAARFGYRLDVSGIGPIDPDLGSPTQMAIFNRNGAAHV
ncbi:MAG: 3'' terminal ribose 2''-O-methyltransferase Hen1 [Chloroflexi bacterium]|nr:3'' terminal ribose 2''-O-methyltransferase Hen1 [Chloroflexota bacterium]